MCTTQGKYSAGFDFLDLVTRPQNSVSAGINNAGTPPPSERSETIFGASERPEQSSAALRPSLNIVPYVCSQNEMREYRRISGGQIKHGIYVITTYNDLNTRTWRVYVLHVHTFNTCESTVLRREENPGENATR